MKTRTRKAPVKKTTSQETTITSTARVLAPNVSSPPFLSILPTNHDQAARIITHPHPATSQPCRYFVCPKTGVYEFTRVAAPKRQCRSLLLAPDRKRKRDDEEKNAERSKGQSGYVLQDASLMVATPVDPLFMLLPVLAPSNEGKAEDLFESFSDHLDTLSGISKHMAQFLRDCGIESALHSRLETRMSAVCDNVDAGDEKMYRLSKPKLLQELISKAEKMSEKGLPASMEEHFVRQPLDVPTLSVKREESIPEAAVAAAEDHIPQEIPQDPVIHTDADSISVVVETAPSNAPPEVTRLLRVRTAFHFLLKSYIAPHLCTDMDMMLTAKASPIEFAPLDKHLDHLASLRREAHALRALSDNISRKRPMADDEDSMEKLEAKKRKKEEEELKKKNMSRGVQQLKKVDTSGMKKLSSFFGKAAAKKA